MLTGKVPGVCYTPLGSHCTISSTVGTKKLKQYRMYCIWYKVAYVYAVRRNITNLCFVYGCYSHTHTRYIGKGIHLY